LKTILITGLTGQDGTYMAEFALACGHDVVGTTRGETTLATTLLPAGLAKRIRLISWDMRNSELFTSILSEYRPAEIFNFAAHSSGAGMYDDPTGIGETNGFAVTRMLEAIRKVDPTIRFCQASSREIFGEASESPQMENTVANPRSPYGAAKLYADFMVKIYRRHYGLFACSAILFNHESPRRPLEFVTRKITHSVARIKLGLAGELHIGNLDAQRDWGFAGDYVLAMWLMLQQPQADDYVVATGETHTVREFCEVAFSHVGLDYRDYLREDASAFRPNEPFPLVGCADKARKCLNWLPQVGFRQLVGMMVDADLALIGKTHKL